MNGLDDVVVFFRENGTIIMQAYAGPEMGMLSNIGLEQVRDHIVKAQKRYKDNKEKAKQGNV